MKLAHKVRHVKKGHTWDAEHKYYRSHQSLGAMVTRAPKGWTDLFGARPASRGLKVVSIVYDWKIYN